MNSCWIPDHFMRLPYLWYLVCKPVHAIIHPSNALLNALPNHAMLEKTICAEYAVLSHPALYSLKPNRSMSQCRRSIYERDWSGSGGNTELGSRGVEDCCPVLLITIFGKY